MKVWKSSSINTPPKTRWKQLDFSCKSLSLLAPTEQTEYYFSNLYKSKCEKQNKQKPSTYHRIRKKGKGRKIKPDH